MADPNPYGTTVSDLTKNAELDQPTMPTTNKTTAFAAFMALSLWVIALMLPALEYDLYGRNTAFGFHCLIGSFLLVGIGPPVGLALVFANVCFFVAVCRPMVAESTNRKKARHVTMLFIGNILSLPIAFLAMMFAEELYIGFFVWFSALSLAAIVTLKSIFDPTIK